MGMWLWYCRCRLSYVSTAPWSMQHANANAAGLPLLWPFSGCSDSFGLAIQDQVVFVLPAQLLQTLILFMLHCSGVNNFISNWTTAADTAVAAPESQKPLSMLMTHDTCPGFEKLSTEFVSSIWHKQKHGAMAAVTGGGESWVARLMKLTLTGVMTNTQMWRLTCHRWIPQIVYPSSAQIMYSHSIHSNQSYGKIILWEW